MAADNNQVINWRSDILLPATKKALDFLAQEQWLKKEKWYLAGGTALALQAGHRRSLDLDFFIPEKTFVPSEVIRHFAKNRWKINIAKEGTIYAELDGVKVSFIAYPFFVPKEAFCWYGSVRILQPADIAVMKIVAISQRGVKRDFVDLYWYAAQKEPLLEITKKLPYQYPMVAHNYHHILKSLTYFTDADLDPMPKIFFKTSWREIKKYFQKEVPQVTRQLLGLGPRP